MNLQVALGAIFNLNDDPEIIRRRLQCLLLSVNNTRVGKDGQLCLARKPKEISVEFQKLGSTEFQINLYTQATPDE